MNYKLNLFTKFSDHLVEFLNIFFEKEIRLENNLEFEKDYESPVDMIEIISTLIDNNDKYDIGIWISLDSNIYINITETNLNKIIKYIFERYPY